MRKLSIILALALAFVLVMGTSTVFAAGTDSKYGGPYENSDPFDNVYNDSTAPKGTGYATNPSAYNSDLTTNNAAYWGNANETGVKVEGADGLGFLRAVNDQDTHGEYKRNTNSCASCHMTHTAAGDQLLFRNGVYNTCAACHDGTIGRYNVFGDPATLQTELAKDKLYGVGGGTFSGTVAGGASVHMVSGSLTIKAAPGGFRDAVKQVLPSESKTPLTDDQRLGEAWNAQFSCASCHAPHGSYSDRLLHYNPNNVGTFTAENGGLKKETISVNSGTYEGKDVYYVGGDNNNFSSRDKSPWLYGYDYYGQPNWTQVIYKGVDITEELKFDYGNAYFWDPDKRDLSTATMNIAPALVVKLDMGTKSNGYQKVTGYGDGDASNVFCAACHTDYNQGNQVLVAQANAKSPGGNNASTARGTFNLGYRHSITGRTVNTGELPGGTKDGNGTMSCLTCHYAHGTTKEIMLQADNTFATNKDANASSALKRYVNQAVCWRCHSTDQAVTLRNNDGYWDGTGDGLTIYNDYNN